MASLQVCSCCCCCSSFSLNFIGGPAEVSLILSLNKSRWWNKVATITAAVLVPLPSLSRLNSGRKFNFVHTFFRQVLTWWWLAGAIFFKYAFVTNSCQQAASYLWCDLKVVTLKHAHTTVSESHICLLLYSLKFKND